MFEFVLALFKLWRQVNVNEEGVNNTDTKSLIAGIEHSVDRMILSVYDCT